MWIVYSPDMWLSWCKPRRNSCLCLAWDETCWDQVPVQINWWKVHTLWPGIHSDARSVSSTKDIKLILPSDSRPDACNMWWRLWCSYIQRPYQHRHHYLGEVWGYILEAGAKKVTFFYTVYVSQTPLCELESRHSEIWTHKWIRERGDPRSLKKNGAKGSKCSKYELYMRVMWWFTERDCNFRHRCKCRMRLFIV